MKLVKNKNMLLLFILFVTILLMSVGYASINSVTGDIEGTAIADAQEGVFITNIAYVSDVNASASNSKVNKFLGTVMDSTMQLSDTDVNSSITYKVTVYNKGTEGAIFQKITYANDFYDNNDIIFEISGFTTGETIASNESKEIIIKFKYKGTTVPDNNVLNSYLNFVIKAPNRMTVASNPGPNEDGALYFSGQNSEIRCYQIETIAFKKGKESDIAEEIKYKFDVSEKQDGSIIGYYTDENNDEMYDLTFLSEDIIYANKNSSYLFAELINLKSINFENFTIDGVTDMSAMFYDCVRLASLDVVSQFDTSKVTNMGFMFYRCISLTSLDVSNFDTSKVTDMGGMFSGCSSLTSLDISNFDTSKVTNMNFMFGYCESLTSLDLSNFDTSMVTDMSTMFYRCFVLAKIDLSNFNTSNVTNMGSMFESCQQLTELNISNFDTSNVTNMGGMFEQCVRLTELDVSNFDTSKVTNMRYMFHTCWELKELNVSNFDTSKVTNMALMFYNIGLTELELSNFDTYNVTDMVNMFNSCYNLTTIYVSEYDSTTRKGWTTENVTRSEKMFEKVSNLVGGNGTKYNSSYIDVTYARIDTADTPGYLTNIAMKNPNRMMANTTFNVGGHDNYLDASVAKDKIESIKFKKGGISNIKSEIKSQFDASEKKDGSIMGYYTDEDNNGMYELTFLSENIIFCNKNATGLFYNLKNVKNIEFDNFNTYGVTTMDRMFSGCSLLTTLDLSKFDTKSVVNMSGMFVGCTGLVILDLSGFDMYNVTSIGMFCWGTQKLTTIYAKEFNSETKSGWTMENVSSDGGMFTGCIKLVGGNGTVYNSNYDDKTYARIDTASTPGYLTKK